MKNKADAGVGIPIKLEDWFVSMLNLASRSAENIGIRKATKGLKCKNKFFVSLVCIKKSPVSNL